MVLVLGNEDLDALGAAFRVAGEDFDEPAVISGFDTEFLPVKTGRMTEGTDVLVSDFGGAVLVPAMEGFEAGETFPEVDGVHERFLSEWRNGSVTVP